MKRRVAEIECDLVADDGSIEDGSGIGSAAHPVTGQGLHPVRATEPARRLIQLKAATVCRAAHAGTVHALPDRVPGSGDVRVARANSTAIPSAAE